jgi:hypothetical protein
MALRDPLRVAPPHEQVIMSNNDHRIETKGGVAVVVSLSSASLRIQGTKMERDDLILVCDIVGVKLDSTETQKGRTALHLFSFSKEQMWCCGEAEDRRRHHNILYIIADQPETSLSSAGS